MRMRLPPLLLAALVVALSLVRGDVSANGLCALYSFVPFTNNFTSTARSGHIYSAATLLAMQHFNERNASIVPQLALLSSCRAGFDFNASLLLDSGTSTHLAAETFYELPVPCAMAGVLNDVPAFDLSTLAVFTHTPLTVARASATYGNDYSTQLTPSIQEHAFYVVNLFSHLRRDNFTASLYAAPQALRNQALVAALDAAGSEWFSRQYSLVNENLDQELYEALLNVKQSGFRTIVVSMQDASVELPVLANVANELQMNNGEYMWFWFGGGDDNRNLIAMAQQNENIIKLLRGSAYMDVYEPSWLDDSEPFVRALQTQGHEFYQLVDRMNPISPGELGYLKVEPDLFANMTDLVHGASYVYDSVMATAIGLCLAEKKDDGSISGAQHAAAIQKTDFTGASGHVRFNHSARSADTVIFASYNIVVETNTSSGTNATLTVQVTDLRLPNSTKWVGVAAFLYADGSPLAPLLRDPPYAHYLNDSLSYLGLSLFGVVVLCGLLSIIWVITCRKHRVLVAGQPVMLCLTCFGSMLFCSAIVTISFDEEDGFNEEQLSRMCQATPWLLVLGNVITNGALFTKLWRINEVLQFRRRAVRVKDVVWPWLLIFFSCVLILSFWTGLFPLYWQRRTINPLSDESIGHCYGSHIAPFAIPLSIIGFLPSVLTGVMAWKTKDVDERYTESFWIFIMTLIHVEIALLAVPIVIVLMNVSSDGRYIGLVIIFWVFPITTLSFIMLPKLASYYKAKKGIEGLSRKRGDANGTIRVSSNPDVAPIFYSDQRKMISFDGDQRKISFDSEKDHKVSFDDEQQKASSSTSVGT